MLSNEGGTYFATLRSRWYKIDESPYRSFYYSAWTVLAASRLILLKYQGVAASQHPTTIQFIAIASFTHFIYHKHYCLQKDKRKLEEINQNDYIYFVSVPYFYTLVMTNYFWKKKGLPLNLINDNDLLLIHNWFTHDWTFPNQHKNTVEEKGNRSDSTESSSSLASSGQNGCSGNGATNNSSKNKAASRKDNSILDDNKMIEMDRTADVTRDNTENIVTISDGSGSRNEDERLVSQLHKYTKYTYAQSQFYECKKGNCGYLFDLSIKYVSFWMHVWAMRHMMKLPVQFKGYFEIS